MAILFVGAKEFLDVINLEIVCLDKPIMMSAIAGLELPDDMIILSDFRNGLAVSSAFWYIRQSSEVLSLRK